MTTVNKTPKQQKRQQKQVEGKVDQSKVSKLNQKSSRVIQKKSQKNLIRLPYLHHNQRPSLKNSQQKLGSREFNLQTSNIKLPKYNPQSDRNLRLFFEKPMNQKLLQKLKTHNKSHHLKEIKDLKDQEVRTVALLKTDLSTHDKQTLKRKSAKYGYYKDESLTNYTRKQENLQKKRVNSVTSHQFLQYIQNVRKRITSSNNHAVTQQKNQ